MSKTLITPMARLSFPSLFEPRTMPGGGTAKYQATLLFDKDAQNDPKFKEIKQAVKDAAHEKWGDNIPKKLKNPFKTIDDLENVPDGYTEEHVFIRLNNPSRPGVVDKNRQDIIDKDEIKAGDYVIAAIHPFVWSHQTGGNGVSLGLDHIMKVKDGEPFGNRTRAKDAFADVPVPEGADDGEDSDDDFDPFA